MFNYSKIDYGFQIIQKVNKITTLMNEIVSLSIINQ